ncbi:MAG TPA: hypothetical protein VIK54_14035 [Acidimicrobiia bacterium]
MSGESYLLGLVVLVAIAGPLWLVARRMRAVLVPAWSGPQAWLADAVVGVALFEAIAQLLGTVGQFRRGPMVAAALGSLLVTGAAVSVRRRGVRNSVRDGVRDGVRSGRNFPVEDQGLRARSKLAIVLGATLVVAIPWLAQTVGAFRTGVLGYDSLNYHLPFAAHFFQTGRTSSLYYTFTDINSAFPANAELIHAVGMVALRRDLLSPVVNLGWLGLALLAAWSAHPRHRVRLATLAGVGVLLSSPLFVVFDGGRATNDLAAIALFLTSIALLLHGSGERAPTALAAVACGMALATKLTMVVPVVALTVGVIASVTRGNRLKTTRVWVPWLVVTGSYWYLRDLVATGNPVPALHLGIGPLSFPTPRLTQPYRSYTVAHYLADVHVWRSWFLPGMHDSFGWAWPVIVGFAAAGWVLALVRGDRMLRMLGAVGIASFLGYLVTPFGAGGPKGRPLLFANDLRFAFPALALGLLLLPRVLPRSPVVRRRVFPALLAIALVNDLVYSLRSRVSLFAVALALELVAFVIVVGLALVWAKGSRRLLASLACVLALGAATAGWAVQRSYLTHRYANVNHDLPYASAPRAELAALYGWVRNVSHARIALAGLGISYPLVGADLSNEVQYIGHRGPHGEFSNVKSCPEWRRLLTKGRYDFVVISANNNKAGEPAEASWTRSDTAAATLVVRAGTASVYRVTGEFDPNGCGPS